VKLTNPYEGAEGPWLKGSLHVHSTNSDGEAPPHDVIREFERLGYDFIALTDHRVVPSAEDLDVETSLIAIAGCEYRGSADSELGVVGLEPGSTLPPGLPPREFVETAYASGGFVIYNHPTWHIHHWPIFRMLKIGTAHALEVYNAVGDWLPGAAECTDKWDRLLTSGMRIFGVATDDAHEADQRGRGWVMVSAPREAGAIVAALKAGRFYASSGVTISSIRVEDGQLTIESPNAQEIRFFADRGSMRHMQAGGTATCPIRDDDIYLRAELHGPGATKAWTNPIFVESDRSRALADQFRTWYLAQQPQIAEW
jgi:hypothetical protein